MTASKPPGGTGPTECPCKHCDDIREFWRRRLAPSTPEKPGVCGNCGAACQRCKTLGELCGPAEHSAAGAGDGHAFRCRTGYATCADWCVCECGKRRDHAVHAEPSAPADGWEFVPGETYVVGLGVGAPPPPVPTGGPRDADEYYPDDSDRLHCSVCHRPTEGANKTALCRCAPLQPGGSARERAHALLFNDKGDCWALHRLHYQREQCDRLTAFIERGDAEREALRKRLLDTTPTASQEVWRAHANEMERRAEKAEAGWEEALNLRKEEAIRGDVALRDLEVARGALEKFQVLWQKFREAPGGEEWRAQDDLEDFACKTEALTQEKKHE
jgi:hypothetical protein